MFPHPSPSSGAFAGSWFVSAVLLAWSDLMAGSKNRKQVIWLRSQDSHGYQTWNSKPSNSAARFTFSSAAYQNPKSGAYIGSSDCKLQISHCHTDCHGLAFWTNLAIWDLKIWTRSMSAGGTESLSKFIRSLSAWRRLNLNLVLFVTETRRCSVVFGPQYPKDVDD